MSEDGEPTLGVLQGRNPLRLRQNSIQTGALAIPAHEIYRTSDYSTTDTAGPYRPIDTDITTYAGFSVLEVIARFRAKHSLAPAEIECAIELYFGSTAAGGGGYSIARADNLLIGHASFYTPVVLHSQIDLGTYQYVPGLHRITLAVRLITAGTLTIKGDSIGFAMFTKEFGVSGRRQKIISV